MTQDKLQTILEAFRGLNGDDQVLVASKLLISRSDVQTFLEYNTPNKLDMLIRSNELCPPFRGLYLIREVHSFKGVSMEVPEDIPVHLRSLWNDIQELKNHEQVKFLESVVMTSNEAQDLLNIGSKELDQLRQQEKIKRVATGLFLRSSIEDWHKYKSSVSQSGKEMMIQKALQEAAKELGSSFTKAKYRDWQKNHPDSPILGVIVNAFGSWNVALKSAGLTPTTEKRKSSIRIEEDMRLCIEGLQKLAKEINDAPTRDQYINWQQGHPSYPEIGVVEGLFTTFNQALYRAGMDVDPKQQLKAKRQAESLESLRLASQCYQEEELFKREMYDEWRKENPGHLSSIQIIRIWGGWKNAKDSAGIV